MNKKDDNLCNKHVYLKAITEFSIYFSHVYAYVYLKTKQE